MILDLKPDITGQNSRLTQHICYGLTPSPFGRLLPSVATSYMLESLGETVVTKHRHIYA